MNVRSFDRSLTIHARELSELKKSCRALKLPTPMSTELIVLRVVTGQPWLNVPGVDTTSTEGESVATAPVPSGIAPISVGPVAERVCTSPELQVERMSIPLGVLPVI